MTHHICGLCGSNQGFTPETQHCGEAKGYWTRDGWRCALCQIKFKARSAAPVTQGARFSGSNHWQKRHFSGRCFKVA